MAVRLSEKPVETARKLLDPTLPSNELMEREAEGRC